MLWGCYGDIIGILEGCYGDDMGMLWGHYGDTGGPCMDIRGKLF